MMIKNASTIGITVHLHQRFLLVKSTKDEKI